MTDPLVEEVDPTIPFFRTSATAMTEATRSVTFRDFLIFQLKLVLDGIKGVLLFHLSFMVFVLDFLAGRGRRPRLFYSLLKVSERFDLWLNLNAPAQSADATTDGLFGASKAGSNSMLGQLEQVFRGGDEPRGGGEQRTRTAPGRGQEQRQAA